MGDGLALLAIYVLFLLWPVVGALWSSLYGAQYAQVMALSLLGALPLFIAFVLFQRQIVEGISSTGLKG